MSAFDRATQHWAAARDALAKADAASATQQAVAARRAEADARGFPFDETFGNPRGETPRVRSILGARNRELQGLPEDRWEELKQELAFACLRGVHPDDAPLIALLGTGVQWRQFEKERQLFKDQGEFPYLWGGLEDWSAEPGPAAKAVFDGFAGLSHDGRRVLVHNAALGREVVRPLDDARRRSYLTPTGFGAALDELESCGMAKRQLSTRDRLMLLKVKELQAIAQEFELPKSGRKADLATRIAEHDPEGTALPPQQRETSDHVWLFLEIPRDAKRDVSLHRKVLALLGHYLLFQASVRRRAAEARELGSDLVQIDIDHKACSLCRRAQGKVFSLSGKSDEFPRLTKDVTPPMHIGCRHILLPVVEDFMSGDAPRDAQAALSRSDRPISSREDWLRALVEFGAPPAVAAGRDAEVTTKLREKLAEVGIEGTPSASWEWQEEQYSIFVGIPYADGWSHPFPAQLVHGWLDGVSDEFWQEVRAGAARAKQAADAQEGQGEPRGPVMVSVGSPATGAAKPGGCLLAVCAVLLNALRGL